MSRNGWKLLAASAALMAFAPAYAQMRPRPMSTPRADGERGTPQQQLDPQSEMPQRQEVPPSSGARLSPEERRQLRRDIHDAGRELYHPNSPRPSP